MIVNVDSAHADRIDELGILPPVQGAEDPATAAVRDALRSDNFPAANAAVERLLRSPRRDGRAEYWAGLVALRTGKLPDAIRSFRRSEGLAKDPYTMEGLALAYYAVGQFHLFEAAMIEAAARLPNDFAPDYYLGRYYVSVDLGDFARARVHLAAAVLHNPAHVMARYYLGYSEECLGNIESSVTIYQEALRLSQQDKVAAGFLELGLARTAMIEGQFEHAIGYAVQAESLSPRNPDAYKILGKLYRQTGQLQSAIDQWETAASLDPTSTAPYYNLYQLYRQTDQVPKAKVALLQYKAMSSLYGTK